MPAERTTRLVNAGKPLAVQVMDFDFEPGEPQPYGLVTVGAKVCEVVPDSQADLLRVEPGWYIAAVNRTYLPGALVKYVRRVPAVTTDTVRQLLHEKRKEAVRKEQPVRITFWTAPRPFNEERVEDASALSAKSIDELKKVLVSLYGDVLTAWNEVLDANGDGELTYKEFVTACRAIGFEGSLQEVFAQMDNDGSGVITIMELDASCIVNINKGRCKVCTLPNPCKLHDEDAQREAMKKEYGEIQLAAERGRAEEPGLLRRFFGSRWDFVSIRVREFVRSMMGQRGGRGRKRGALRMMNTSLEADEIEEAKKLEDGFAK